MSSDSLSLIQDCGSDRVDPAELTKLQAAAEQSGFLADYRVFLTKTPEVCDARMYSWGYFVLWLRTYAIPKQRIKAAVRGDFTLGLGRLNTGIDLVNAATVLGIGVPETDPEEIQNLLTGDESPPAKPVEAPQIILP